MSEVQPKEIWILKTPGGEFVEHDEPMNYDWRNCRKTKFVEYSAHDSLKKENEELKDRIGKLRKALQKYADSETHSKDKDGFLWHGDYFDYETAIEALKEDGNG